MTKILFEEGIGIRGEKIGYECRTITQHVTQISSSHKGVVGKMDKAECVILQGIRSVSNRKFRLNK